MSKDLLPHVRHREARQRQILEEALGRGQSVVVDNTNPAKGDRAPLVSLARTRGARVIAYFFDVSTREAVARNAERTGRERVPNVAIFRAAKRLEPPTADEGFDQLFRVRLTAERAFHVCEIELPAER